MGDIRLAHGSRDQSVVSGGISPTLGTSFLAPYLRGRTLHSSSRVVRRRQEAVNDEAPKYVARPTGRRSRGETQRIGHTHYPKRSPRKSRAFPRLPEATTGLFLFEAQGKFSVRYTVRPAPLVGIPYKPARNDRYLFCPHDKNNFLVEEPSHGESDSSRWCTRSGRVVLYRIREYSQRLSSGSAPDPRGPGIF